MAQLLAPVTEHVARQHGFPNAAALRRALHRAATVGADGVTRAQLGAVRAVKVGVRWRLVRFDPNAVFTAP